MLKVRRAPHVVEAVALLVAGREGLVEPQAGMRGAIVSRPRIYPPYCYPIAELSLCDVRTVARAFRGERVTPSTHERLRRAAIALCLPEPPPWRSVRTPAP